MSKNGAKVCIYVQHELSNILLVASHENDLLIASDLMEMLAVTKKQLSRRFKMKYLEESKTISGMDIDCNRGGKDLFLSQRGYLLKIVTQFGMQDSKRSTIFSRSKRKLV